jgi:glycosyltransferase involved in cell wall biosynthesis
MARSKIGFLYDEMHLGESQVSASTRIRVFDVIKMFKFSFVWDFEVYQQGKDYDVVVFQKTFSDSSRNIAIFEKEKGTTIVYDININLLDLNDDFMSCFPFAEKDRVLKQIETVKFMLNVSDYVITPTNFLKELYEKYNCNTFCIEESIDVTKKNRALSKQGNKMINLCYIGYSVKAKELLLIENALRNICKDPNVQLCCICEKEPQISLEHLFIKYDQSRINEIISQMDVKVAPRDLRNKYNLGHAFTKIGLPMSCGLPVVASAVPSYLNTPAIIANNEKDWENKLRALIDDVNLRIYYGDMGRNFVQSLFSRKLIKKKYKSFFYLLLTKRKNR